MISTYNQHKRLICYTFSSTIFKTPHYFRLNSKSRFALTTFPAPNSCSGWWSPYLTARVCNYLLTKLKSSSIHLSSSLDFLPKLTKFPKVFCRVKQYPQDPQSLICIISVNNQSFLNSVQTHYLLLLHTQC